MSEREADGVIRSVLSVMRLSSFKEPNDILWDRTTLAGATGVVMPMTTPERGITVTRCSIDVAALRTEVIFEMLSCCNVGDL